MICLAVHITKISCTHRKSLKSHNEHVKDFNFCKRYSENKDFRIKADIIGVSVLKKIFALYFKYLRWLLLKLKTHMKFAFPNFSSNYLFLFFLLRIALCNKFYLSIKNVLPIFLVRSLAFNSWAIWYDAQLSLNTVGKG